MKTRDTSKQELMYHAIREWEGSGLSIHNYCSQRGITYESFRYWKKKYSQQVPQLDFVPIAISEGHPANAAHSPSKEAITITRPGGIRVECPVTVRLEVLQTLINL